MYVDYVYDILKADCVNLDTVYEEYIIHRVGTAGLHALQENQLIESCGVIRGRKLYVLCEKGS